MSFIHTALSVDDINALKALNGTSDPKRVDKMFLVVGDDGTGFPGWYRYRQSATNAESLPRIVASADNVGRWFQFNGGSNSGGGSTITGNVICTGGATVSGSGKAFQFTSYNTFLLNIAIGSGVNIASGSASIIVHLWSQEPNVDQDGKIEPRIASLPNTGGSIGITPTSTNKWMTLGVKFADNPSFYDVPYFTISGNNLTIVGR